MTFMFPNYFDEGPRSRRVTPGDIKPSWHYSITPVAEVKGVGRGIMQHDKQALHINVAGYPLDQVVVYTKDNKLVVELSDKNSNVVETYSAKLKSPAYEVEHVNGLIIVNYLEDEKVYIDLD